MRFSSLSLSSLMAVASLGLLGASAQGISDGPRLSTKASASGAKAAGSKTVSPDRSMASIRGNEGYINTNGRRPGPGWTNSHVQRLARKRRNVKANRKNHR